MFVCNFVTLYMTMSTDCAIISLSKCCIKINLLLLLLYHQQLQMKPTHMAHKTARMMQRLAAETTNAVVVVAAGNSKRTQKMPK